MIEAFLDPYSPSKAKAMILPVLVHETFTGNVRTWLRRVVIDRKDFLTPSHLPICSVVAGKFPTMENKLYSHFKRMSRFSWHQAPENALSPATSATSRKAVEQTTKRECAIVDDGTCPRKVLLGFKKRTYDVGTSVRCWIAHLYFLSQGLPAMSERCPCAAVGVMLRLL